MLKLFCVRDFCNHSMNHLSNYSPSNSSIYPWQQRNWQHLIARYRCQNLPHALLFGGAVGLGKLHFARCFARFLFCNNKTQDADPSAWLTFPVCTCHACALFYAGNHPDFFLLQPEAENKALKVEQIRELISELSSTASQGSWQVVIIDHADAMNTAAANALLKSLEEPLGDKTMLILVTAAVAQLPATVASRCQKLAFVSPSFAESSAWLQQQLMAYGRRIESAEITAAIKFSHAAPLAALSLLAHEQLGLYDKILRELLDFLAMRVDGDVVKCAESLASVDVHVRFLVTQFLNVCNDLIKCHLRSAPMFLMNQQYSVELQKISSCFSLPHLLWCMEKLIDTQKTLTLNIALNKQLLIENLLLNFKIFCMG